MESKIREPAPSARLATALGSWRIRSDARDFVVIQETVGAAFEPALVSRLERDTAIKSSSQHGEERARYARVECEAWRQLQEQAAQPCAHRCDLREKVFEKRRAIGEPLVMRDRARNLDGKAERAWHAPRPPLESRGAMRAIESGIDLHRGEYLRITRKVGFARRKARLLRTRNAPSCGPDVRFRRHVAILCTQHGHSVGVRRQPTV